MTNETYILSVNAGSSSVKLALFAVANHEPKKMLEGAVNNIGQQSASLSMQDKSSADVTTKPVVARDHATAADLLTHWLQDQAPRASISAVGHRLVHGGPKYHQPLTISDEVIANLEELTPFNPDHLPVELNLIKEFQKLFPGVMQVACFDTAFHRDLPTQARLISIPRHFEAEGIRRYGFHGLSCAYVLDYLNRTDNEQAVNGNVIIAHLGSGVSLTAVQNGSSVDTTMGLTPASGVPMSTRSGDLDPGLALYLARTQGYDAQQFNDMVNFKSGLLGISETTADMKKLLEVEDGDHRAKEAVDLFCYQVKKAVGSLSAVLGGLDILVFTGGMGENAPKVRARVCDGLGFLGINLDASSNDKGADRISTPTSRVTVRVVHTDEAVTIAREVASLMKYNNPSKGKNESNN